jgi:hypothetical protein
MRQVDVRVINPAARNHVNFRVLTAPWSEVQSAIALILLCTFWGVILYLGLSAF